MKFLAILRDSLREALDSKVIYFLLGLSALVILLTASLSFRPKSGEEGMVSIVNRLPGGRAMGFGMSDTPLRYTVEKFEQLNEAKHPWEGSYRFELVVTEQWLKQASKDKDKGKEKDRPKEQTVSRFRLLTFIYSILIEAEVINPVDRAKFKEILIARDQIPYLPPERIKALFETLGFEVLDRVTPGQMERMVADEVASRGTLDVPQKSVRLLSDTGMEFRFLVEVGPRSETYRNWPHNPVLFFGAWPWENERSVGTAVQFIEDNLVGGFGAGIAMLLSTIITAFYIPNMLRKGSVDVLLAKPIHRGALLTFKFIGGLTFMFLNTLVIIVGIWLVLSLRSGLWAPAFLLSIVVLTFQFAIFYSVSTLFGVLTRSPVVAILMSCLTWLILWGVGTGFFVLEALRETDQAPKWLHTTVETLHFVLPRYKDLDALNTKLIAQDLLGPESPERQRIDKATSTMRWSESIGFTCAFIALMLGLSCWRFATKDY
jgi:ABC-type transport system involved in multi-copper enzyme maturation permease subunit